MNHKTTPMFNKPTTLNTSLSQQKANEGEKMTELKSEYEKFYGFEDKEEYCKGLKFAIDLIEELPLSAMTAKDDIKYFIEDMDNGLWYYDVMKLPQGHTAHTTIYYPKEKYWTNNPLDALSCNDKKMMQDILDNLLKAEDSNFMTEKYGEYKNLKVTEHQFVSSSPLPAKDLPRGEYEAWSTRDVLEKLIWAADCLLHEKDYDGHGHEEVLLCVNRGKEILKELDSPLLPREGNEAVEFAKWIRKNTKFITHTNDFEFILNDEETPRPTQELYQIFKTNNQQVP